MIKYIIMFYFIGIVTKAELSLTKEEIAKIQEYHDVCSQQTGVDKTILEKAMKGTYTNDSKLKKHLFCTNKKMGFQNEEGNIMQEHMMKKLMEHFNNEKIIKMAVNQCALKKDTPEDTALAMVECLHTLAPEGLDASEFIVV